MKIFFIAVFFFGTIASLAGWITSLRYADKKMEGSSFAFCLTIFLLLVTWGEW